MPQPIRALCHVCRAVVTLATRRAIDQWRRSGRAYCSTAHRDEWVSQNASARMADTNRRCASARMKARNPMRHPAALEKMRLSLRAIRHRPPVRGGNGRPVPLPQRLLAEALGWPTEVILRTGGGYKPYHYKLDIANRALKIAIEVDGMSHGLLARKAQDARKDAFLRGHGWTVLRFSNQAVMENLSACVLAVASTTSK